MNHHYQLQMNATLKNACESIRKKYDQQGPGKSHKLCKKELRDSTRTKMCIETANQNVFHIQLTCHAPYKGTALPSAIISKTKSRPHYITLFLVPWTLTEEIGLNQITVSCG